MNSEAASKLCETHGSILLHYQSPSVARLLLPSGEQIAISIGTTSAKIFRRRALLGWFAAKCCASKSLIEWEPRYTRFNGFHRAICRGMILDGLVDLVSRAHSIGELCLAWCAIRNPLEVASVALFQQTFPDAKAPDETTKT